MTQYKVVLTRLDTGEKVSGSVFKSTPKAAVNEFKRKVNQSRAWDEPINKLNLHAIVTPYRNYHEFKIKDGRIKEGENQ